MSKKFIILATILVAFFIFTGCGDKEDNNVNVNINLNKDLNVNENVNDNANTNAVSNENQNINQENVNTNVNIDLTDLDVLLNEADIAKDHVTNTYNDFNNIDQNQDNLNI